MLWYVVPTYERLVSGNVHSPTVSLVAKINTNIDKPRTRGESFEVYFRGNSKIQLSLLRHRMHWILDNSKL